MAAAALNAANGSFVLNGTDVSVDLSAASIDTYDAIATAIQAALQTDFSGATFVYSANQFILTLAGSDPIDGGALADTSSARRHRHRSGARHGRRDRRPVVCRGGRMPRPCPRA